MKKEGYFIDKLSPMKSITKQIYTFTVRLLYSFYVNMLLRIPLPSQSRLIKKLKATLNSLEANFKVRKIMKILKIMFHFI